jgi:hypothetical protein
MIKRILFLLLAICLTFSANAQQKNAKTKGDVRYKLYLNYNGRMVPDFSTLGEPNETGTTDCIDLEGLDCENGDHYAMTFEYDLKVKKADTYTFRLCSDDGSNLYIDGKKLIDDDGEHGPVFKVADIKLEKGTHLVRVDYFEYHKSQSLTLYYKNSAIPDFIPLGLKSTNALPKFVVPQAKETAKRVKAWKGNDEVIIFPILTDVHTCNRTTYKHIGYMVEMDKYFGYDFMVNLGDIGLNTEPAHSLQSFADMIINNIRNEMAKYKGVFLFAPGNHEYDGGGGRHITSGELSELFQKPSLPYANGNLHLTDGNCWSYYDVPGKNLRLITLNSQNTETIGTYYTYGMEQLEWLIKLLNATPAGTDVLVFSHFMPNEIGRWPGTKNKNDASCNALMSVLSAYANKQSGKEAGLKWDFSKANGRLLGLFTGDSHINAHVKENGVNYFISQGYGRAENKILKPEQKRAWFNSRESLCCDIVVIKPATREVHTFRVGAGGADMDYMFKY